MESKLAFTQYGKLNKWHIDQYLQRELVGKFPMVSLSEILRPRKERVSSQEYNPSVPLVGKIRFADGRIFYRTTLPKNDVFSAKKNDLLVSNINFEKGAFCIVEKDVIACSTDYQPYEIICDAVTPQYLNLCLRCESFLNNVANAKPKGLKTRAKWEFIKTFSVPVPPIPAQHKLVEAYRDRILRAQSIQNDRIDSFPDNIIEERLQLQIDDVRVDTKILTFKNYSRSRAWDAKNEESNVFTSLRYPQLSLSAIARINPPPTQPLKGETDVSFVPMECVSDSDGCLKQTRICKSSAKGFTKFENGDIIWAKITPCMQNGKSAVVYDLKNGIGYGSTEFYVIRVDKEKALPEYIHYLLRTHRVRRVAVSYFSGAAGQQRVRKSFLEELSVPLPSLEEQKEIVEILDRERAEIIAAREQAERLLAEAKRDFEKAVFA